MRTDQFATGGLVLSQKRANVTSMTDSALTRLYVGTEHTLHASRPMDATRPDSIELLGPSLAEPHSAE